MMENMKIKEYNKILRRQVIRKLETIAICPVYEITFFPSSSFVISPLLNIFIISMNCSSRSSEYFFSLAL
jgi:hypothetical protein